MLFHAEATSLDILARHWSQIFVACVMIEPFGERLPTEGVIEFTNLPLDISSIAQRMPPKLLISPIPSTHIEM
jgi:hypothetical protein